MTAKTMMGINLKIRSFTMDAIYTIFSSAVTALLFTAGWSVAVGRRVQTIDDLKSGFIRLEGGINRLEESITKLVDRVSKIEGKVDGVAMAVSSISAGK
jgi:hypothetical protein